MSIVRKDLCVLIYLHDRLVHVTFLLLRSTGSSSTDGGVNCFGGVLLVEEGKTEIRPLRTLCILPHH